MANRQMTDLRFQFDFQEHDLGRGLVLHVMLDTGLAEVGFSDPKLRLGALPVRRHDGHLRGHRNDHVIHLVNVMAGGAAGRQPPLGDADLRRVDLNLGFGAEHRPSSPDQGTNSRNTKTANTTICTSPNMMLVRPVPKVSMLSMNVNSNS